MVGKQIFNSILGRLHSGGMRITYWDGDTYTFGPAEPYFQMYIKTPKALRALLTKGSLGFGECYTDGSIEIDGDLQGLVRLQAENDTVLASVRRMRYPTRLNKNTRSKQKAFVAHHYDLGNDFYKLWLDRGLVYSCAYFKSPSDSLETAQKQKIEHILRKLQLQKGQSLLDIGSGWGTLLITAAKEYGTIGHGITLSKEQLDHSQEEAKRAKVDNNVTFELISYHNLPERGLMFDRIVSIGMFEHVGRGNHTDYYQAIHRMLKPNGLSVLHTITQQTELPADPWTDKYIFPGGYIPSNREIIQAFPTHNFRLLDYENLRMHYTLTLEEWLRRYEHHASTVIKMFDERFYRMWRFWLACSAASFRYGSLDLSQYVFTKGPQNNLPLTRDFLYT